MRFSHQQLEIFGSCDSVCVFCKSLGIEIDRDVNATRKILRLAHIISSVDFSVGEFGNAVKEIHGILLL